MGFSVTASHVIFAFAILTAGSAALGAYWTTQDELAEAHRVHEERADRRAHTNVAIDGTPAYDSVADTYTFSVKNSGSVVLNHTLFVFLVDGIVRTEMEAGYPQIGGAPATSNLLLPGEVLTVRLTNLPSAPSDLKVTTENAVSAYHPG